MSLRIRPSEIRLAPQWFAPGEPSSASTQPGAKVRNIQLLKLTARALYQAFADNFSGKLQQLGRVMIIDHTAHPFLSHHFKEAPTQSEARTIALPLFVRAFSAMIVPWVMFTSRTAVREYLQLLGSNADQKIPRLIAAYAQVRVAIWVRRPSAFLVSHDLVPIVFFVALAAAHADLPIWLILLDHAVVAEYPFTARGAIGFQPHDACSVRPQPGLFLQFPPPEQWKRQEVSRALVVASHPSLVSDGEEMVSLLAEHLLGVGVFDTVAVRPHPSHTFDLSKLPPSTEHSLPGTPLNDDALHSACVFFIAPTSAMNTVRSVGVPAFSVNVDNLRQSGKIVPADLSEFLKTGVSNVEEIARSPCESDSHASVVEFNERGKFLDFGGFRRMGRVVADSPGAIRKYSEYRP